MGTAEVKKYINKTEIVKEVGAIEVKYTLRQGGEGGRERVCV